MNRRAVVFVAVLAILCVSSASAQVQRPGRRSDEAIPLKNWSVDFESISGSAEGTITAMALPSARTRFTAITPCRVADTRNPAGPYGGPFFSPGQTRTFNIPGSACGVPVAAAYSLNFTIVNYDASNGFVTAFPAGTSRPPVSTVNYGNGSNAVANAAIVPANDSGAIDVFSSGTTQLIIDINGYFDAVLTLQSGQTLTGSFGIDFVAAGVNNEGISMFSFSPRLASAPTANLIITGGASTANCPGTVSNPLAAPGHLCVYERSRTNVTVDCVVKTGTGYACGSADAWGAGMFLRSAAAGRVTSVGSWAVTAP